MREKKNEEQLSGKIENPEKRPANSSADLPPLHDDDGFARRAGEIIARATAHLKDTVRRPDKRR
jgi:hypothetical protein